MTLHITLAMQRQGSIKMLPQRADSACNRCGLWGWAHDAAVAALTCFRSTSVMESDSPSCSGGNGSPSTAWTDHTCHQTRIYTLPNPFARASYSPVHLLHQPAALVELDSHRHTGMAVGSGDIAQLVKLP